MIPRTSVKVTDPTEQRKSAEYFVAYGGANRKNFAHAITVTGKRARKLLKRAKRQMFSAPAV
jgi:hypothetical protein